MPCLQFFGLIICVDMAALVALEALPDVRDASLDELPERPVQRHGGYRWGKRRQGQANGNAAQRCRWLPKDVEISAPATRSRTQHSAVCAAMRAAKRVHTAVRRAAVKEACFMLSQIDHMST